MAFENLTRRIGELEGRVFGAESGGGGGRAGAAATAARRSPSATTLAEDIAALHATLDGMAHVRDRAAFAESYAEVKGALDASPWDWRAKLELVLASEEEVRRNVELVREIEALRASISAAALDGLPEWRAKANALEQKQRAASAFVEGFHARVGALLSEYNAFVGTVSQKFVVWDEALAACEDEERGKLARPMP